MRDGGPIDPDVVFIVCLDFWRSIVKVGWEDGLGTIDHEEGHVTGGLIGSCPYSPEHRRELGEPACAELV